KKPERRYTGCQELADDLTCWLRGEPTRACPVGPLGKLWRWARREPGTAALVGAVALLLLLGSGGAWGLARWGLGEKERADWEASLNKQEAEQKEDVEGAIKKSKELAEKWKKEAKASKELANKLHQAAEFQAFRAEDARHAIQMGQALRAWEQHNV